jgi:uncharacterized protein
MSKNKYLIVVIALILLVVVFYSLNTSKPYSEQIQEKRREYISNLITMEDSPLKAVKDSSKIKFFEPNSDFVINAKFTPSKEIKVFKIQMTDSTFSEIQAAGNAVFNYKNKEYTLLLFDEGEHYLLPFKDLSNKNQTYGGGRYINIPKSNLLNNDLEIDFNDSHNFYCAYSEKFVCPIPPKENSLNILINAGELKFK